MSGDFSHLRFVLLGLLPFCAILALSASTVIYLLTALRGQSIKLLRWFTFHFPLDLVDLGFVLDSLWIHFDYFDSCYATFSFAMLHSTRLSSFLFLPFLLFLPCCIYNIKLKSNRKRKTKLSPSKRAAKLKRGTMVEQKSDQSPFPFRLPDWCMM